MIQVNPCGQNCIIVFDGSNQHLTREQIDETLSYFTPGDYLMAQNENFNLDYVLEAGAAKGLNIVPNALPINDALLQMDSSGVAWLVVNEIECAAIAGCDNVRTAYETLKARYPHTGILLTLGPDGAVSWKDGEEIRQAAFPVNAVDTTAGGDTFMGYFVGCLAQGHSRQEAMLLASRASSIAVARMGAAPSIPWMEEVRRNSNG